MWISFFSTCSYCCYTLLLDWNTLFSVFWFLLQYKSTRGQFLFNIQNPSCVSFSISKLGLWLFYFGLQFTRIFLFTFLPLFSPLLNCLICCWADVLLLQWFRFSLFFCQNQFNATPLVTFPMALYHLVLGNKVTVTKTCLWDVSVVNFLFCWWCFCNFLLVLAMHFLCMHF